MKTEWLLELLSLQRVLAWARSLTALLRSTATLASDITSSTFRFVMVVSAPPLISYFRSFSVASKSRMSSL